MAVFAALRFAAVSSGYMRTAVSNISLNSSEPGLQACAAKTQFLRLREHDAPDLLRVAERADGVRDPVVRVAQRGVAVFQQEIVLIGIGAFDFRLLGVGFERTVDQGEYLRAVRQVRAFDIAAQSGPVLRFVIGLDDPLFEAVELSDMFFQRFGTAYGQHAVVRPRTFG